MHSNQTHQSITQSTIQKTPPRQPTLSPLAQFFKARETFNWIIELDDNLNYLSS